MTIASSILQMGKLRTDGACGGSDSRCARCMALPGKAPTDSSRGTWTRKCGTRQGPVAAPVTKWDPWGFPGTPHPSWLLILTGLQPRVPARHTLRIWIKWNLNEKVPWRPKCGARQESQKREGEHGSCTLKARCIGGAGTQRC